MFEMENCLKKGMSGIRLHHIASHVATIFCNHLAKWLQTEHGIPDFISFMRARNPVFWPKRGIKNRGFRALVTKDSRIPENQVHCTATRLVRLGLSHIFPNRSADNTRLLSTSLMLAHSDTSDIFKFASDARASKKCLFVSFKLFIFAHVNVCAGVRFG